MFSHLRVRDTPSVSQIVLLVALLLGFIIRGLVTFSHDFPPNDGGLFFNMVQDLSANNLSLPLYTTYNQANIPFAYPPLGLYVAAILAKLNVPLIQVFRYLPLLVSTSSILAFYQFAHSYLENELSAAFATIAIALLPEGFQWRIMGGGLTRSLGFLFGLLTLNSAYHLLKETTWKQITMTGILGAATVLSHPEATFHFALGVLLIMIFFARKRNTFFAMGWSGLITVLITSVWWLPVLEAHSISLIFSLLRASSWTPWYVLLWGLIYHLDPLIWAFTLLGLIANQKYKIAYLLTFFGSMFLILPRSAPQFAILIVALFFGIGLELVYKRILLNIAWENNEISKNPFYPSKKAAGLIIIFAFIFIPNWVYTITSPIFNSLSQPERDAMEWIKNNTIPHSRFLIIDGEDFIFSSNAEWFPALTGRVNAVAVQGYEWLENVNFRQEINIDTALQTCGAQNQDCITAWSNQFNIAYSYIYIVKGSDSSTVPMTYCCFDLKVSLDSAKEFELIYENNAVAIYKKVR